MTNGYSNRLRVSLGLQQPTSFWTNSFIYDASARLTNVTSRAGAFNYTYHASRIKLPIRVSLPNSSYITNTYDNVARLTGTYLKNSGNSTLDSTTYGYNTASQRTTFTNAAGTYYQFSYDRIGQLTIADSSVSTEDRGYAYDTAWNLHYRTNNGTLGTFNVDSKNQLTSEPGYSSDSYDGNGNLTFRNNGVNVAITYTYDDENRLTSVFYNDPAAPTTSWWRSDYVYDGLSRARKRTDYTWLGGTWAQANTAWYIYDDLLVIEERSSANVPTVAYTRGRDLSGTMQGAGGIGGLLARSSVFSAGNPTLHYYYHADGNGNITYLADSSQALAASYRYDPFGNTISSTGPQASGNVYRFSSKEIHVNSGMYYYGYRFYDPTLQRWVNRDPIGESGGRNLYRYAGNGPINRIDSYGLRDIGMPGNPLLGTGLKPVPFGTGVDYALGGVIAAGLLAVGGAELLAVLEPSVDMLAASAAEAETFMLAQGATVAEAEVALAETELAFAEGEATLAEIAEAEQALAREVEFWRELQSLYRDAAARAAAAGCPP